MADNSQHGIRAHHRHELTAILLPTILGLISGAAGLALAMHYPIAPAAMIAVVLVCWVVFFSKPYLWLLVLPALLPVIGLAPWTGWITFEELDVLVLAAAAGGYTRLAWQRRANRSAGATRHHRQHPALMARLLVGLFVLSTIVAMYRGFADAGGFKFGWFQGYHEPMNSVRLAKDFLEALLLVRLWQLNYRHAPARAHNLLSLGMMLGLATAALTTVWERAAFPGLLNFSADYRTTGMFWEMHVGGAALDGFLALTVPFALREFLSARTPARWGAAATVLALAAYACLTTFSRGVYLAVPVGLVVYFVLTARQQPSESKDRGRAITDVDRPSRSHRLAGGLLVAGFGVGAAWMFQSSGYRGIAALLGTVSLMLPMARVMRSFDLSKWVLGGVLGTVLVLLAGVIAWLMPGGAYLALGLPFAMSVVLLGYLRSSTRRASLAGPMAFAGFATAVAGTALVVNHWGEAAGLLHAAPVLMGVLGVSVVAGTLRKPLWPEALRWQATTAGAMGLVAAIIGVFGGGAYMSERFSTGGQDLGGRQVHWQLGLDMLRTQADWLLGKGLGRFPPNYFLDGNPQEHPGDYRLNMEGENAYITVTSGLHQFAWGAMFRVTQRVSAPGQPAIVTARVRAAKAVSLHFEVCEKHLLYGQACLVRNVGIKSAPGVWQDVRAELQGNGATRGDWYAPRLLAFSIAIDSLGGLVDLDNIALIGANGQQLLANGDFDEGMTHWFFSSDRHHLPWHIKNVFMNVLFDQGIVGVTLWCLLLGVALWRTTLGSKRTHPLAPTLAASLTGFAVVGLFDSLLDVPRLGVLFYLLLLVALTLRGQTRSVT